MSENKVMYRERAWKDRLRHLTFPSQHPEFATDNAPFPVKGYARHEIRMNFSLLDRLRVLLTGRVLVNLTVESEEDMRSCRTASSCHVQPPRWLE